MPLRSSSPTNTNGGPSGSPSDTLYEDAMIAATALEHGLTVVTRNTADFAALGIDALNPFEWRRDARS